MGEFVSILAATLKSAIFLPIAPTGTVRHFAERPGSMGLAIGVALVLVFFQTLSDPVSLTSGWNESVLVADYSMANILVVFGEYAILTIVSLAVAIAVALGLGGSFLPAHLAMARLPSYGFATVWFIVFSSIDKLFFDGQTNDFFMVLLLIALAIVLVGIWIPYRATAGLSKTKAAMAFAAEFAVIMLILVVAATWGGTS